MARIIPEPLTPEQLKRAIELKAQGLSVKELVKEIGLPPWRFYQSEAFKAAPRGGIPQSTKKPRKQSQPEESSAPDLGEAVLNEVIDEAVLNEVIAKLLCVATHRAKVMAMRALLDSLAA